MRDGVADVLAQRARLNRGAGSGVLISALLHGGLSALLVFGAMRATTPKPVGLVNIQFVPISAPATPARTASKPRPAAAKPLEPKPLEPQPAEPKPEEPKPRIEEPKPVAEQPPAKADKNTVPLSPFGQSTKKGSETPAAAKPAPAPPAAPATVPGLPGTTTADIPVGGSGVTGLEGGNFPYTIYITGMQRRIGSNWFRPQIASGATAVVYFRIQRDGTISDAKIETTSGNGTFDRAALSAVRSSSPLTRLPADYVGTYLGVHLTFR
ncbi:MAG TPA: TonB family protein [Thermoanaerobaculia bacterium]|jgi:TonB family protein